MVFKHANNCKVTLSTFLQAYCTTPQVFSVSLTQVYKINQPISVPLQTFVKEWVVLISSLNMVMVPKEDITVTTPTTFVKFLPSMIFSRKCFYSKVKVSDHAKLQSHMECISHRDSADSVTAVLQTSTGINISTNSVYFSLQWLYTLSRVPTTFFF